MASAAAWMILSRHGAHIIKISAGVEISMTIARIQRRKPDSLTESCMHEIRQVFLLGCCHFIEHLADLRQ
jgi:hypothetical protein